MKKDALLLSIILTFGSLLLILWFINPNFVISLKDRFLVFAQDMWILTKNFIYNFGR